MAEVAEKNCFGLSEFILDDLRALMRHYPSIETAAIYGSRGRGDYRSSSDIDIAISAPEMETLEWMDLCTGFRLLPIVFDIDKTHLETCLNEELRASISRDGKVFYVASHRE